MKPEFRETLELAGFPLESIPENAVISKTDAQLIHNGMALELRLELNKPLGTLPKGWRIIEHMMYSSAPFHRYLLRYGY
jgi:hypothetical protein